MKKVAMMILASAMILCLTACNSMESDAKKLAKMHYDLEQIGNRVGSTSNIYTGKAIEVLEFEKKTLQKYSNPPETQKQFQEILEAEYNKLKRR